MAMSRNDGLDNALSPNGPNPQYYLRHEDGTKDGPYSCPREAELSPKALEMDDIVDHKGRVVVRD